MSVNDPRDVIAALSPEQREMLRARLQKRTNAATVDEERPDTIPRRARPAEGLPLSFAQQRLWLVDQLVPGNPAYNMPASIRLSGPLDATALAATLAAIARRHETLRTSFRSIEGTPVQVIAGEPAVPLPLVDLSGLPERPAAAEARDLALAEAQRPFRLDKGPLLRAVLLRMDVLEHRLLLTIHHVISDGWSINVLQGEIAVGYGALSAGEEPVLPELPIQYADFSLWQRERLRGEFLESQLSYWRRQLESPPRLQLPADRPRPAGALVRGALRALLLPPPLQAKLEDWAREEGATLFMVLLASFGVLLSRYSGQQDLVVGSPIANRDRHETEGLIGFFVNTLALRLDLAREPTAGQLLRRVRKTALDAYSHKEVPFERLVEEVLAERYAGENPLFQVLFALQTRPAAAAEMHGLWIEPLPFEGRTTQFDLSWSAFESSEGLNVLVLSSTDLYDATTIARMLSHFESLLRASVGDPRTRVSDLAMLTAAERHQIGNEWENSWEPQEDRLCLHELFAAQAARTPAAIALSLDGVELCYEELNRRANQIAWRLIELGVGDGVLVALLTGRTLEMVVAILGILKAGGAYVPLDPAYPRERLAWILEDTRAPVVLTEHELLAELPAPDGAQVLRLDELAEGPAGDPPRRAGAASPAYVIYTSGSTGRPKGVVVLHVNVVDLFESTWESFRFGPGDAGTLFHSQAFDFSVWEIWAMLLYGGRLVLVPYWVSRSPAEFRRLLVRERVTVLNQTPSAFRQLIQIDAEADGELALRVVVFGGEALDVGSLRPWLARYGDRRPRLINMYGITETTVHVTYRPLSHEDLAQPARSVIGRAIPSLQIHLLDHWLQPVPIGVPGEIFVGGGGVARGYLGRPALTAERFVPDLGSAFPGARLYRSGDAARYLPDGHLEFLGRIDQQVKLRGFRIELGEIEAVLAEQPGVRESVVAARDGGEDGARLVAYVVLAPDAAVSMADLRRALLAQLPDYMVPSPIVPLGRLPLTPSGKVDRRALPEPGAVRPDAEPRGDGPRTPTEQILAGIWAGVIGGEEPGRDDDFFALGGHSLLAAKVAARAERALGVEMPLAQLFARPTVAALGEWIDGLLRGGEADARLPLTAVERVPGMPLSLAQERLWLLEQLQPGTAVYNVPAALRLRGRLNVAALEGALGEVARRHEVLRTSFQAVDGRPVQVIAPAGAWRLPVADLAGLPSPVAAAGEAVAAVAGRPFDLAAAPPWRAVLLRLGPEDHAVVMTLHHMITDGWSMEMLQSEVRELYLAFAAGLPSPLPELPVQYADFASWQSRSLTPETLEDRLTVSRERLAGAPPALELPTDRPRPPVQSSPGGVVWLRLPEDVTDRVEAFSRGEAATLFITLLTVFTTLLSRYTGQDDIVVGVPSANRTQIELEELVGFFVNLLPVRVRVRSGVTFHDLLREVRAAVLAAHVQRDLPFERLVEALVPERDLSRPPLVQATFDVAHGEEEVASWGELRLAALPSGTDTAKFELALRFQRSGAGLAGALEYPLALFDPATVQRLASHLAVLAAAAAGDPSGRVAHLPLLTAAERHQALAEWSLGDAEVAAAEPVHRLILRRAAEAPEAPAVVSTAAALTYGELAQGASALAARLRGLGVRRGDAVAVCLERSPDLAVAMLGSFLAGAVYVPLDPELPSERLGFMLRDARAAAVVTREGHAARLPLAGHPTFLMEAAGLAEPAAAGSPAGAELDDLAYLLYTSGSTGEPKGVAVAHRSLAGLAGWHAETYALGPGDRCSWIASPGFDASIWELLPALSVGASLHVPDEETRLGPERLAAWMAGQGITGGHLPPLIAEGVIDLPWEEARSPRFLLTGGDKLRVSPRRPLPFGFFNHYGPTEATVTVTRAAVPPSDEPPATIGRPIAGARVYVLDPNGEPVPAGVPGEICLGGPVLAYGYVGRLAETASRFIPDPFGGVPGARLYRTGDLGRLYPDGNLEFLGRTDHQIKIRGIRVELGEIEAALGRLPEVRAAVVLARDDSRGERSFAAYVVPREEPQARVASADNRVELWPSIGEYFVYDELIYHGLTQDELRNGFYREALRGLVRGRVVVDLGTGRDAVLSRLCAELGARKVYALEILEASYQAASRTMRELGLDGIATVIHGDSRTLELPEPADVCVSEIVEAIAGSEGAAVLLKDARRLLKPDGVMVPERSLTRIAAASLPDELHDRPAFTEVSAHYVRRIFADVGRELDLRLCVKGFPAGNLLSGSAVFEDLDTRGPLAAEYQRPVRMTIERDGRLDGFLLWLVLEMGNGQVLDILEQRTSWFPVFFPVFYPGVEVERGDRIEAQCVARLTDNGVNPDYAIEGELIRRDGQRTGFRFDSTHHGAGYRQTPFYDRLFRDGIAVATAAPGPVLASGDLAARLRQSLRRQLPEHMVPASFTLLDTLPLTANGKIDRRALASLAVAPEPAIAEPPLSPAEEILAGIWTEVLGQEGIGRDSGFFELGGHSLLAMQAVSRVRQVFGVDLPLRALFEEPRVAGLARILELARREDAAGEPPLAPVPRTGELPLSFSQERLWFIEQLEPGTPLYNIPVALRLRGALDLGLLAGALAEIVRRHEVLRTTFRAAGSHGVQVVSAAASPALPVVDLTGLPAPEREREAARLAAEEARRPFDLGRGPLLRVALLALGNVGARGPEHLALVTAHHIVSDAWSTGLLVRELSELMAALAAGRPPALTELPLQYGDYAVWQRRWLSDERLAGELAYWRRRLAGAPTVLELPTDRPRPVRRSQRGGSRPVELPAGLARALVVAGRKEGATLFMTLMAAFQVLLARYSGQEDLLVGTPVAGRDRVELESLLGFFVNTLVIRAGLSGDPGFDQVLRRLRDDLLADYDHQSLPFERLVEELQPERSLSHTPLFQVVFTLQSAAIPPLELPGLSLSPVPVDAGIAKFDLTLTLSQDGDRIVGGLEYSTDLFDGATMVRWLEHYRNLLAAVAESPRERLSALQLLAPAERHQAVAEWNDRRTAYPADWSLARLFEARAAEIPDAPVLSFFGESHSFRELDEAANRLAWHLRDLGVGVETPVAVCLDRSPQMVVAILAILKAGGYYVPLDPAYPLDRLLWMLDDAGAAVLLTRGGLPAELAGHGAWIVDLEGERELIAARPVESLPGGAGPDGLAYVMYTSGSTGRPKGVAIPQRGVIRLLLETDYVRLGPGDRIAQISNVSFDAATFEIWGALLCGGCLVGIRKEVALSSRDLAAELREQGITALFLTAALFQQIAHESPAAFAGVDTLLIGGQEVDAVAARIVLAAAPPRRMLNGYGPTESTTFAATYSIGDLEPELQSVPIGRPIANTRLHILDRALQPTPLGAEGRLYIGGDGLGRGYWRRPELTAERFVPDPFGAPGARLYDSGDLTRALPDGRILFLGRSDHQVKIRGYRIELGEIETVLAGHPAVASAVVLALRNEAGDQRLVAYVVPRDGGGSEAGLRAALRDHLRERLPEYMIPAAFVVLAAMPLTPNGKVDRRALPAPGVAPRLHQEGFVAARTYTEQVLAEIWSELLSVEPVGRHDDFFALGGHSLLATQAASRARRAFQVEIPLQSLFERPTLAELAREVDTLRRRGTEAGEAPAIPRVDRGGELPLSFAQQRLWFLEQLAPGGSAYNVPIALRCRRPLAPAALAWAVSGVVGRHEALRTRFESVDGRAAQRIEPAVPIEVPVIDLSGLAARDHMAEARRLAREDAARPFDLLQGYLLRAALLRLAADDQVLLLCLHHIVSDGWSLGVLLREAEELYAARVEEREPHLPELPIQYADFADWQRRRLRGGILEDHLAYARRCFGGGLPVLDLPADAPPSDRPDHRGGSAVRMLPGDLTWALRGLGREQGCTLAMTLLAGFELLLHRLSGQSDLIVGMVIANRNLFEIEGLIGFFVNTLALRTDFGGDPSFRRLLDRVREVTLEGYAHQDLPFERLVEEVQPQRDLGRNPLFEVLFNHLSVSGEDRVTSSRLSFEPLELEEPEAKLPLSLYLSEVADGVSLRLIYQRARFSEERIGRMLDQLEHLLGQLAATPDLPISAFSLVTPAARRVLPDPAAPLPEPSFQPVADLVLAQAVRGPARPALRRGEAVWSYGELAFRVEETARALATMDIVRAETVAVTGERDFGLVVSLLAVLRSGGVLLTLDPALPAPRRRLMLETAGARRLVHSGPLPAADEWLAEACPARLGVDAATGRLAGGPAAPEAPLPAVSGDDPAYVFFTSGSTGAPKGVVGVHKGLSHFLDWQRKAFGIGEEDRGALLIALSFDAVLRDLFLPLTSGACLHLPERDLNPEETVRWLDRAGVTYVHAVPAAVQPWLSERPAEASLARLRWLFLSGEPLTGALAARWREAFPASGPIVNFYGATEATMIQSSFRVPDPAPAGVQPVGRPLPDTQLLVLSGAGRLCGIGEPGEVLVRTPFRSRGYLSSPEEQARAFVPNPFRDDPGDLLYRTGDRGRYRPDGALEVLGRLDDQVKIRGVRVEPEEVAANLLSHPGVKAAVVVPWGSEPVLAAYVVAVDDFAPRPDLRAFLAGRLPSALVPGFFTWLERLPLTPTGKVDRRALPAPEIPSGTASRPRTLTEELLATLWSEVLGVEPIGPHDDFFALGGHSLLATQVMSRVSRVLGAELPLRTLFESPRLGDFAARVDRARAGGPSAETPLERALHRDRLPLSFGQERLWFFDQLEPGSPVYNVPLRLRMRGVLEVGALAATLSELVRRHEVLRTRFVSRTGKATQVVEPPAPLPLPVVDLSGLPEGVRRGEGERLADEETARPFDLGRAPLLRVLLLRLAAKEHEAVLTMHHIASDGWSLGVLIREVEALYGGRPLPELPVQYGDFASWQREHLSGAVLESQVAYWRGQLAGSPGVLELPTDRPRPAVRSFRGARRSFVMPAELAAGLVRLSRGHRATLFMTLLAGFEALLWRVTGQRDLSVGMPVAGRTRVETEDLIGFFVNTLVLRTELSAGWSFEDLLVQVREVALEAHAHQEVPFERLVEELRPGRDLSRTPLFQVMFTLQNVPLGSMSLGGLELEPVAVTIETAKFDLELSFAETATGLQGWWTYATDLFDPATIARMEDHLERVLRGAVAAPEAPLDGLALLSEAERHQVGREWGEGAWIESGAASVVELWERQAARRPEAPALVHEGTVLSFGALDGRANVVARRLRALGVGPESRVGLCVERSPELVIGLLGILKAGGAYVPLDPSYPEARLRLLVEDSGARVVVTGAEPPAVLAELGVESVAVGAETAEALAEKPASTDLAYLIYTSGTTGTPKAVMVEHGSLANLLEAGAARFGWTARDRMPCVAPFTFDIFLFELLSPLLAGGTSELVSLRPVLDLGRLLAALESSTRLHAVPTLLRQVVERARPEPGRYERLRTLFVGGDAVPAELLRDAAEVFPQAQIHVLYGPTEGTVLASSHAVPAGSARPLLGRPLPNMTLSVRDEEGAPAPVGMGGELWIGGPGVSRGYLHRPELTAEKYAPSGQGRWYRTGDRARWLADGTLEFLGRVDQQVKVRGFRIEPGEVESALAAQPGVGQAVVVARADGGVERRLVAYLVGEGIDLAAVRAALRASLPDYMVPAAFVVLPALALTAHGKVDRAALPAPEAPAAGGSVRPRTETERVLARIWSEVLGVAEVGVEDNFFDLGGDSILTLQILAKAERAGLHLTPRQMFEHQTVAALAAVAVERSGAAGEQGLVTGPAFLTPVQRAFFATGPEPKSRFVQALLFETVRPLAQPELAAAMAPLTRHHDALRLRFVQEGESWAQHHEEPSQAEALVARIDLSALPAHQRSAQIEALAPRVPESFELTAGPLVAAVLFHLGGDEADRLLLVIHHLLVDGVSWRLLLADLEAACQAVPLPAKTTSFQAWAERLREHAQGRALEELPFWRMADAAEPLPLDTTRGANDWASARQVRVALSAEETEALLRQVPAAYRTRINDVLLAALVRALSAWSGRPAVLVELEGHGREELFDGVDLSRTVGWLTALYPVAFQAVEGEGALLKAVKEQLRRVPGGGVGFGALRYLSPEGEILAAQREPEVSFNYLGQLDRALEGGSLLRPAREAAGSPALQGPRPRLLDVVGSVAGGRLRVTWTYSKNRHRKATVERLAQSFVAELETLIAHCLSPEAGGYTPSDFPLAGLDQATLDRLVLGHPDLEDLYPLSPMQEGMLFHSLYKAGSVEYFNHFLCRFQGKLDIGALQEAWRHIVGRHAIFRTAFLWEGLPEPLQVVHREVEPTWELDDWRGLTPAEQDDRLARFREEDCARGFDLTRAPLMRMSLFRLTDESWQFVWSHHHLLLDGWSLLVIFRQSFEAYKALVQGRRPEGAGPRPFCDYIAWLRGQDPARAEAFWRRYLKGFQTPTSLRLDRGAAPPGSNARYAAEKLRLPAVATAALQERARRHQLTVNTLVQAAWALLLHRYSGSADVVFGTVVSGRPAELAGMETMVGPFINALPVRVRIDPEAQALGWLRALQEQQVELRQHEHSSLVQIQGWSAVPRGRALFESSVAFDNYPVGGPAGEPGQPEAEVAVTDGRYVDWNSFPISLDVAPREELSVSVKYNVDRFDASAVQRLLRDLRVLLEALAEGLDRRLEDLGALLDEADRKERARREKQYESGLQQKLKRIRRPAAARD